MKKLYYKIDNGDQPVICELDACIEMIKAESDNAVPENSDDAIQWTITQIWLTDEEYDELPEAY